MWSQAPELFCLFFQIIYSCVCFWLCWIIVAACGLSLVAASRGYSLVATHRLLIAVASLVVEHRVWGPQTSGVVARGFSCPETCGIFLDRGLNPHLLHWQADS